MFIIVTRSCPQHLVEDEEEEKEIVVWRSCCEEEEVEEQQKRTNRGNIRSFGGGTGMRRGGGEWRSRS